MRKKMQFLIIILGLLLIGSNSITFAWGALSEENTAITEYSQTTDLQTIEFIVNVPEFDFKTIKSKYVATQ